MRFLFANFVLAIFFLDTVLAYLVKQNPRYLNNNSNKNENGKTFKELHFEVFEQKKNSGICLPVELYHFHFLSFYEVTALRFGLRTNRLKV